MRNASGRAAARPGASRGQIGEAGPESLLLDIENDPGENNLPR